MNTLFWLDQIAAENVQVGEQALHLSFLVQKNYPVLPSFVISAPQFRQFLEAIDWLEPFLSDLPSSTLRLNVEDPQQLQAIARQIRQTIQQAKLPEALVAEIDQAVKAFPALNDRSAQAVILRPSLAIDGGGGSIAEITSLLEAQICQTDTESLETGLKQLWAELFRARNLVYWQRLNISLEKLQFAVLVQPIADTIAAGYLQSSSTGWDVTAAFGLEPAISRGEMLPDLYHINPETGAIQYQKRGHQTIAYRIESDAHPLHRVVLSKDFVEQSDRRNHILSASHLQEFLDLTQRLNSDFTVPVLLEWQLYAETAKPQLYLTQLHYQNPLEQNPSVDDLSNKDAAIVTGLAAAEGQAIAPAEVVTGSNFPLNFSPGSVLVTSMILPDWLPLIKQAAAIVTEQGGMTSHGAIIARELGIPAVVSAARATERIQTGDPILVDGRSGKVFPAPLETPRLEIPSPFMDATHSTFSPIATQLMVNLSQSDSLKRLPSAIDGIGLLRSELMMLNVLDQQHPQFWTQPERKREFIDRLATQIQEFAEALSPRPVFYRSLDSRLAQSATPKEPHELQSLQSSKTVEPNPMLGLRGTFSYLQDPALFECELLALKQVITNGFSNLRLILPFVRTVEEFIFCRQRVEQIGLMQHSSFQLWIMAEVPSVLFLLPEYVRSGVQGICIGTSDLTQLILGIDRDQGMMANAFNETQPAVMSAIVQLIQSARQLNIPCSISTQAAIEATFIDRLVEAGITTISVNLNALDAAHRAIARAEQRLLLNHARNL